MNRSGVVLFCRNADAHRGPNRRFTGREVGKAYHALVSGGPQWDEPAVEKALRADTGRRHRTVVDDRDGKPSATRLLVLERFGKYSLLGRPGLHSLSLGFVHPAAAPVAKNRNID